MIATVWRPDRAPGRYRSTAASTVLPPQPAEARRGERRSCLPGLTDKTRPPMLQGGARSPTSFARATVCKQDAFEICRTFEEISAAPSRSLKTVGLKTTDNPSTTLIVGLQKRNRRAWSGIAQDRRDKAVSLFTMGPVSSPENAGTSCLLR